MLGETVKIMEVLPKAVSNSLYTFLNWATLSTLGYIFWVILAKTTTTSNVGILSSITNIAMSVVLVTTLSMNYVLSKIVPEYQAKGEAGKISATNGWAIKMTSAATLAAMVAIALLSPYITASGYLSSNETLLLLGMIAALYALCMSETLLYALQSMKRIFVTNALAYSGRVAAVLILFWLGYSFHWFIAGIVAVTLAAAAYRLKWIPMSGGPVEKGKIWSHVPSAMLSNLSGISMNQGGIILLSILGSMAGVGVFTIAFMFSMFVRAIPQVLSIAIMPICAEAYACKQTESVKRLISYAFKTSFIFTIPLAVVTILFSKELLESFATANYVFGTSTMQIMTIAFLIHGISSVFLNVLYYTGSLKSYRNISVAGGALNIIMCAALIPQFGIKGAAAAFFASAVLLTALSMYASRKKLGFSFELRPLAKNLAASLVFAVLMIYFKTLGNSMLIMTAATAVSAAVYVALLLLLRYFDNTDIKILETIRSKRPEFGAVINPVISVARRFSGGEQA